MRHTEEKRRWFCDWCGRMEWREYDRPYWLEVKDPRAPGTHDLCSLACLEDWARDEREKLAKRQEVIK